MRISKLAWVGTRTENAEPRVAFFGDVLGLRLVSMNLARVSLKLAPSARLSH
jgi:hypothetical protein